MTPRSAIRESLGALSPRALADLLGFRDLRERGQTVRGSCPLHHGDGDGFVIFPGDSGPAWTCHSSCGGGDALALIARAREIDPKADFARVLEVAAHLLGVSSDAAGSVERRALTVAQLDELERKRRAHAEERAVFATFVEAAPLGGERLHYLKWVRKCWNPRSQFLPASELGLGTYWPDTIDRVVAEHGEEVALRVLGSGDPKSLEKARLDFGRRPLILPATNSRGEVVAIQGRSIATNVDKRWRYTSRGSAAGGFFGGRELAHDARLVVLAEGALDALTLRVQTDELTEAWGPFVAVGRPGAGGGLSAAQANDLRGRRVLIAFDGDEAGNTGARRAANALAKVGVREVRRLVVPPDSDLNDLARATP